MTTRSDTSDILRGSLVQRLIGDGSVRSQEWINALRSVPREEFISGYFRQINEPDKPTRYVPFLPSAMGRTEWLSQIYKDETLITQLGEKFWADEVTTELSGLSPTSSSTLPSLVVWMLEELDVCDGDTVLEIGTGTGYSTALLCERLGARRVTSVEYDPEAARRASSALHRLGCRPHLIAGDGMDGAPDGAPFDRIIATCSVPAIPPAWLAQARPGGTILATLTGSLHGFALAKLTVNTHEVAEGRVLPGYTSFMPSRTQLESLHPPVDLLPDVPDEPTQLGSEVLDDWTGRFVAQLAAPHVVRTPILESDLGEIDYLTSSADGSIAALIPTKEGWTVRQRGPRRIWDDITTAITQWHQIGSPPLETFHIRAEPGICTVSITGTDFSWTTSPTQGNALTGVR